MTLLTHNSYRVIQKGTLHVRGQKFEIEVGDTLILSPKDAGDLIEIGVVAPQPAGTKIKRIAGSEDQKHKSYKVS